MAHWCYHEPQTASATRQGPQAGEEGTVPPAPSFFFQPMVMGSRTWPSLRPQHMSVVQTRLLARVQIWEKLGKEKGTRSGFGTFKGLTPLSRIKLCFYSLNKRITSFLETETICPLKCKALSLLPCGKHCSLHGSLVPSWPHWCLGGVDRQSGVARDHIQSSDPAPMSILVSS